MATMVMVAALCVQDAALCEVAADSARGDLVKLEGAYAGALSNGWSVGSPRCRFPICCPEGAVKHDL